VSVSKGINKEPIPYRPYNPGQCSNSVAYTLIKAAGRYLNQLLPDEIDDPVRALDIPRGFAAVPGYWHDIDPGQ